MRTTREEHNRYQRAYYGGRELPRMRLEATPYVRRHFDEVARAAGLAPGGDVLEIGAGTGRFTAMLARHGMRVTATDLSDDLLASLRAELPDIETLRADVAELGNAAPRRYGHAVGFFVLHHLLDLEESFRGLAAALEPGARVAFAEPNGYNALFYLQILLTPGMTWRGDGGVLNMRPPVVLGALARAGFTDCAVRRYGFFPPFVSNRPSGRAVERVLEGVAALDAARAFQVFSARLP